MKIISVLILMLVFSSCSSKKGLPVSPDEYLNLNKNHAAKHKACIQHRTHILEKPIMVAEEAELDDELYFFLRNEQKALFYIDNFDISKFTLKENQLEYEAIIKACVQKRDPKHITCDTLFSGFKFFRGLIYGMNQYKWSPGTKIKAKNITLKYLEYVGQSESSLMDIIFANDLLMRLSQRGYVNKDIYQETIVLRKDCEKSYEDLKKQIRKLGKKDLTCQDADAFYTKERIKVKELSRNFLVILNKVLNHLVH